METKTKTKRSAKKTAGRVPKGRSTVGARIIQGWEQAIASTRGENENVRVTLVHVPEVDVREVQSKVLLATAREWTRLVCWSAID